MTAVYNLVFKEQIYVDYDTILEYDNRKVSQLRWKMKIWRKVFEIYKKTKLKDSLANSQLIQLCYTKFLLKFNLFKLVEYFQKEIYIIWSRKSEVFNKSLSKIAPLKFQIILIGIKRKLSIDSLEISDVIENKVEILKIMKNLKSYLIELKENTTIKPYIHHKTCQVEREDCKPIIYFTDNKFIFAANIKKGFV